MPVLCTKVGEDLTESYEGTKKCLYRCTDGATFTLLIDVGDECPGEFVK
jgi:hypothetical protein